jgi:hypothetical protein
MLNAIENSKSIKGISFLVDVYSHSIISNFLNVKPFCRFVIEVKKRFLTLPLDKA